jgi:hypothetical protein
MRPDTSWITSLSAVAKTIPPEPPTTAGAKNLRTDVFAATYSGDNMLLGRLFLARGKLHTYTLWGEEGDASNTDAGRIAAYCFTEPMNPCGQDTGVAVADEVAIDIELASGSVATLTSTNTATGKPHADDIVVSGKPGEIVVVEVSSRGLSGATRGDFKVFYDLLEKPAELRYRALPSRYNGPPDEGGACSPVRP